MTSMWVLSCVVLPLGLVLTLFVMSGFRFLEKLVYGLCQIRPISCGDSYRFRLVSVIVFICFLFVVHESVKLANVTSSSVCYSPAGPVTNGIFGWLTGRGKVVPSGLSGATLLSGLNMTSPECRAYRLRHERNWWIAVTNFVVWASLWRMSAMLNGFLTKIDTLQAQVSRQQKEVKATASSGGEPVSSRTGEEGIEMTSAGARSRKKNVSASPQD
eukprot:GHVS01024733.1.p1 GENE.GHVS01024733.1~~GHVS01024733.1.p1  ORF type:complete len:215 (+),score=26.86 GHVS01024733.1:53-697(+)